MKSAALLPYLIPRAACVDGPRIDEYERGFALATASRHAVGFWKGRVAFFAALKALGISEGDEIIMPGYTCMVVPAAARFLGAVPVYVDIEPRYCTLNPDKLPAALTARTRAIMIQHTYGWPSAGIEEVIAFANAKGLPVLEDCCHALGTSYAGRHVGNFGIAGFFSSQWSKPFTTGLGGMLVCNDNEFHQRVCRLRDEEAKAAGAKAAAQLACQGIIFDAMVYPSTMSAARRAYRWLSAKSFLTGSTSKKEYCGWQPDYFRRLCQVQAVAGLYELRRLDAGLEWRRRLSKWYAATLKEMGWPVPEWPANSDVTPLRFPVRIHNKAEALQLADRHWVELGDWFIRPLHSTLAPQEEFGYREGMCPEADRAAREIINLPTHPRVSVNHAERVIRFLRDRCQPVG